MYDIHKAAGLIAEERKFTGFESKMTQLFEGDTDSLAKASESS